MTLPEIRTERLLLRPVQETDAPAVAHYMNDETIADYVPGVPYPYTEKMAHGFIKDMQARTEKGEKLYWTITREGAAIGGINLHDLDADNKKCKVGYLIGKEHWGKGYATEALRAITGYAFDEGYHRVQAEVFSENPASMRVLEKAGFVQEGVLRDARRNRGRVYDEHVFGLLRQDP